MSILSLFGFSATPGSNPDINGTSILGTGLVSTADDSFRNLAAFIASGLVYRGSDLASAATLNIDGATTPSVTHDVTGTVATTAITLTSGQWRLLRAVGAWPLTASATLIINGSSTIGYTCSADDILLVEGFSASTVRVIVVGHGGTVVSAGSSVGFTSFQGVSTEAAAAAGPIVDLFRNSASPAASDQIGQVAFTGRNSTPATKTYASVTAQIDDATAASEDASLVFQAQKAGTLASYLSIAQNAAGAATANAVGLPLGQLSFPASQNPSSDANTLDDYEEGTWTPTLGGTATYTTQAGRYTKIGNKVLIECHIAVNAIGSGSNNTISGLPFASVNAQPQASIAVGYWAGAVASFIFLTGLVNLGASTITLAGSVAATASLSFPAGFFGASSDLYFICTYSI